MTAAAWVVALDAFEAHLGDQRLALDGDDPAIDAFVPPTGLGALPPELAPRARALLADAEALALELARRATAAAAELDRQPQGASPSFFDQRV